MPSKFKQGEKMPEIYASYFTGTDVKLATLTDPNKELSNSASNVVFGKGIRNIWHKHEGGQILIVISGKGYYQELNKEKQLITEGDVITIGKNVIHWHGATEDSEMEHIAITGDPHTSTVEWLPELEEE